MEKRQSFSTADVARFCHVTADTIRKWAEAGRIQVFKTPGGHRRIQRDALLKFLRDNQIPLPSELEEDGVRALIVEPDAADRAVIHDCLVQSSPVFHVETAHNAYEAGLQVGRLRPELIFLSLDLPGVDPLDVCTRLRTDTGRDDSKVVALLDNRSGPSQDRLRAVGVDASVPKPVTLDAISSALSKTGHL